MMMTRMVLLVVWAMAAVVVPGWAMPSDMPVTVLRADKQQGGFLIGRTQAANHVSWNGKAVHVRPDGVFVVGFDRYEAAKGRLVTCQPSFGAAGNPQNNGQNPEGYCHTDVLTIAQRTYNTQAVKGVAKATVNPDPVQTRRVEADSAASAAARKQALAAQDAQYDGKAAFAGSFIHPVRGPITGGYGNRRTYNGEERSWHRGGDFAAKTGTPVVAPADGVVRLARETFMSGNLILVDHGGGITTAYAHLSRMDVTAGQRVSQGDQLGLVGSTGRSTGPHLHWGLYWQSMALDPILWLSSR